MYVNDKDRTTRDRMRRRIRRMLEMTPRLAAVALVAAAVSALPLLAAGADSSTGSAGTGVNLTPAVQSAIDSSISENLASYSEHLRDLTSAVDSGWLLVTSFLIFFMQAGFALLEAGAVGSKDIISILLKNFTDFAISTITYWLVGEGFQRGRTPFIGASRGDDFSTDDPADMAAVLSAAMFCATAVTIVSGAIACRFSFHAYMILCVVFSGFIYPIAAGWVWSHGFLSAGSDMAAIDFAGSGIVHLQGATIALTAAVLVGPRLGRFVVDPSTGHRVPSTDFNGNSIVLTALGTLILFFGWFGFNAGSTGGLSSGRHQVAALAALNTACAGSSALMTGLILTRYMEKSYNFWDVLNSTLAGLVAVTAACATVGPAVAIGIGILAAGTYHFTNKKVLALGIDDVVGAFSVHGTPGAVGLLCTGLFSRQDYIDAAFGPNVISYHPARQFGIQLLLLLCVVAWSFVTGGAVLWILSKTLGIRVSNDDEIVGLDFKYHSGYAYETHNKRMLRAKKQIEREQILGQKMRKQHVAGAAAAQHAAAAVLTPPGAGGGPSANGSRYNTLFRDHVNGLLSSNKHSGGAPASANDISVQRTPVTDPLRPGGGGGGGGGGANLAAPHGGGGNDAYAAPRSGAPSFNGLQQQMDMMLAVPEFGEHDPSSSGDQSSLQDDMSVQSGQRGPAQHVSGLNKSAMHVRTRSQASANIAAAPGGVPQSPNSNTAHLAPGVAIYHYSQPPPQMSQQQPLEQLSAGGGAGNQQLARMPGQVSQHSAERSGAETSRSSNPPRGAAAGDRRASPKATSQSAHNSPVQAPVRLVSHHVSFNELDAMPAVCSPTAAAAGASTDSGPATTLNSASSSLAAGVQLPVFLPRAGAGTGAGAAAAPSSPSPGPTFHVDSLSPKSMTGPRRLDTAAAAATSGAGAEAASATATIHAPRPQALPVYVSRPKSETSPQLEQQPGAASTAASSAAAAAPAPSSSPAFQFKFVGSASTQAAPPQ